MRNKYGRSAPLLLICLVFTAALLATGTHGFSPKPNNNNNNNNSSPRRGNTMCFQSNNNNNSNNSKNDTTENADNKNDFQVQTWNPLRLLVLRLGFTEPAATSPLNYGKQQYNGDFTCAYCGNTLFESTAKYDSKSGWPSFWRSADDTSLAYKPEWDGRLEVKCQKCQSHLGHVFMDGPRPDSVSQTVLEASPASDPRSNAGTYLPRFCINGAALRYQEKKEEEEKRDVSAAVTASKK